MRLLFITQKHVRDYPLIRHLYSKGHQIDVAVTPEEAWHWMNEKNPDAILIFLREGNDSGATILKDWRKRGVVMPVVCVVTVRSDSTPSLIRTKMIAMGADNCLTEPCCPSEVTAVTTAIVRRSRGYTAGALGINELNLNPFSQRLRVSGHTVRLTPSEYVVMETLMLNPCRPVSKELLNSRLNHDTVQADSHSLYVLISKLRKKISQYLDYNVISNVRGVGFILKSPSTDVSLSEI